MKQKLPKREIEICVRLRQARELRGLTQPAFARQVGLTREQLINYEYKRAPLRWDLAARICRQFFISERWLATGKGPFRQYLDLVHTRGGFNVPYRALFSEAYDKFLAPEVSVLLKEDSDRVYRFIFNIPGDNCEVFKNAINHLIDLTWDALIDQNRIDFFNELETVAHKWWESTRKPVK